MREPLACRSALKALACRGLRVGPSKHRKDLIAPTPSVQPLFETSETPYAAKSQERNSSKILGARLRGRTATQHSKKGSEKVLGRVLRRGSEKGVSGRCLERPLGEYDLLGVHPPKNVRPDIGEQ